MDCTPCIIMHNLICLVEKEGWDESWGGGEEMRIDWGRGREKCWRRQAWRMNNNKIGVDPLPNHQTVYAKIWKKMISDCVTKFFFLLFNKRFEIFKTTIRFIPMQKMFQDQNKPIRSRQYESYCDLIMWNWRRNTVTILSWCQRKTVLKTEELCPVYLWLFIVKYIPDYSSYSTGYRYRISIPTDRIVCSSRPACGPLDPINSLYVMPNRNYSTIETITINTPD